jgi:hypothetical protein
MGRGSGADAISVAPTREPVPPAVNYSPLSDKEDTTLRVLFNLDHAKPEALGFSLAEIAEAGLPEFSPKDREGAYRLIAETADSLVEKGLAECSSTTDPADSVQWKINAQGKKLAISVDLLSKLRISELGAP